MKKWITMAWIGISLTACKTETNKETAMPQEVASSQETERSPAQLEAKRIADKNGAQEWDKVSLVKFTFNVDRGDTHTQRSWVWNPRTQDIKMTSEKESLDYNRKDMDSTAMETDKGFVNDAFWLTAPLHLVWDESATVILQDTATAPLSKNLMKMITLTYPQDGGYTPGDAYDFYYGDNDMVQEWVYRRGNVSEFTMATTFEDYKDFNGIKLAMMHQMDGGKFKLYFTDVDVEMDE